MKWTKVARIISIILGVMFIVSIASKISQISELYDFNYEDEYRSELVDNAIKQIIFTAKDYIMSIVVILMIGSCATALQNMDSKKEKDIQISNSDEVDDDNQSNLQEN